MRELYGGWIVTPSQRVLVVDDEQYFRDTIRDALVADGIACDLAASGAEVPKAIEDPRVACVLLDVGIQPDAIATLAALLQQRPALRVIAVATRTEQELVLEALRRGACDYLAKPIHDEELCLAVRRAFAGHAVESRWDSARERLSMLAVATDDIERAARGGADREEIAARLVAVLAEVAGAERASLLRATDEEAWRVEASEGEPIAREELAELAAPLDAGAGVYGTLCISDRRGGGAFGDEDLALLRLLARAAARWLDPRAPETAAPVPPVEVPPPDPNADVELLRAIADGMTREIDPARLFAASLRPVARATSARVASFYLIDNLRGHLACEAQCEGTDVDRAHLPRDSGLTGAALQSGAIVATDRPERDPRFDPLADTPESGRPGPMLVIPLRVRERVLGVVRVFPAPEVGASARLGELVAAPLSAATRNVLLYRSLLESVDDVARARREAEARRGG